MRAQELTELTKNVEMITLDINKQQIILDKLNILNNEKLKKVTELERYLHLKRSKPAPKEYNYDNHQKTFAA